MGSILELLQYYVHTCDASKLILSSLPTLLISLFLAVIVYFVFFYKLNKLTRLEEVGYISFDGYSKKMTANLSQRLRKIGNPPPVYPNGWYLVCDSFDIKVKETQFKTMIGLQLAVFRDESGEVHILDAYCPHLGANLGVGGRVKGDCIECPFHGWLYRGTDGKCVSIPAMKDGSKIPENAKVKHHICREVNDGIYLWFHAEDLDPTWQLPEMTEISTGHWSFKGRTKHMVNAHIEEINENGSDVAHLETVHDASFMAGTDLRYIFSWVNNIMRQEFRANWSVNEPESYSATMNLTTKTFLFGSNLKFVELQVQARQYGPAVVYLEIDSLFGRGVFIHCVTPLEPLMLKVTHSLYMYKWLPCIIPTIYLRGEAFQIERDIMIWNNKEFKDKPIFAKSSADSFLLKHRRWYSQFYSENSPRLFSADNKTKLNGHINNKSLQF